MPNKESQSSTGDNWLGIFFLGTTIVVFIFSRSIHSIGLGDNFDPGPKAFPIGLSILLAIGGAVEFIKRNPPKNNQTSRTGKGKSVLLLLGAFALYVLLLPWLGFALSTGLMATAMMMLLGNPWWSALSLSLALITIISILFIVVFNVPLPGGALGLPF